MYRSASLIGVTGCWGNGRLGVVGGGGVGRRGVGCVRKPSIEAWEVPATALPGTLTIVHEAFFWRT